MQNTSLDAIKMQNDDLVFAFKGILPFWKDRTVSYDVRQCVTKQSFIKHEAPVCALCSDVTISRMGTLPLRISVSSEEGELFLAGVFPWRINLLVHLSLHFQKELELNGKEYLMRG